MPKSKMSEADIREDAAKRLYPNLANRSLARKLAAEECRDITEIGKIIEGTEERPLLFELSEFNPDGNVDYAYIPTEQMIGSIGKHSTTGKILAAFDARFYQNPDYDCLFLR